MGAAGARQEAHEAIHQSRLRPLGLLPRAVRSCALLRDRRALRVGVWRHLRSGGASCWDARAGMCAWFCADDEPSFARQSDMRVRAAGPYGRLAR